MNPSLSLLVLRSADPERLAAFYAHLGMKFVKHRHGSGPEHFSAELGTGGVFEIYPLNAADCPTTATRIGFCVDSVADACADISLNGGRLVSAPKIGVWGMRAVLDDPEGHRIELTERKVDADGSPTLHDA
ncbi:MAG: VOC family protein [Prosthecobacter sp.]|uniref:VOC family protein n=1 Tax=Prosthecobacter sp. TaxID=1965333 RepID=UPI0025D1F36F|nr:VOC family protein [Prosthecobacter sp.]MCF7786065.1 VOC family protein [Prosthecobacter sp.]